MGYTHYLRSPMPLDPTSFARFFADIAKLIGAAPSEMKLSGIEQNSVPMITAELVVFNGGCEPFIAAQRLRPELGQRIRDGKVTSSTKTMKLPYDRLVVASLFSFIHHFSDAEFMTDGRRDELRAGFDWFQAECKPNLGDRDLFKAPQCREG